MNRRHFLSLLSAAPVARRYFDMGAAWQIHASGLAIPTWIGSEFLTAAACNARVEDILRELSQHDNCRPSLGRREGLLRGTFADDQTDMIARIIRNVSAMP